MKLLLLPALFLLLTLLSPTLAQDPTPEPDVGALPLSVADAVDPVTIPSPRPTIYGLVTSSGSHSILARVFDALNVSRTLDEPGARFTLFAPTDDAFRELARPLAARASLETPEDVVRVLVSGVKKLKQGPGFVDLSGVVFYHLLNAVVSYADLQQAATFSTAQGRNLTFVDGRVRDRDDSRPDANPNPQNIFTLNGWVHSIDRVLLPFNVERAIAISRASPTPLATDDPNATDDPTATDDPSATVAPTDPTDPSVPAPVVVPDGSTAADPSAAPDTSPDTSDEGEDDDGVCFPSTARVHTPDGPIPMHTLNAGMQVVHHESGAASNVFLFTHRTSAHKGVFYRIETAAGHAVTMTGNHYLYANARLVAADSVSPGDALRTVTGLSAVTSVRRVYATGLYAPHSVHGDLVVDGIVVSGYSRALHPGLAHAILAPVRWFVTATGVQEPFGSLLYGGGRGVEKLLPRGKDTY